MTKSIVYLIHSLYEDDYMSVLIGERLNWLAYNTDYEISVITTEKLLKGREYVKLSPQINLINLDINFDELKSCHILTKSYREFSKKRQYKNALRSYLKKDTPLIIISLLGYEFDFLHEIKTNGYKILEIHDSIDKYIHLYNKFPLLYLNYFIKKVKKHSLQKKLMEYNGWVTDTHELKSMWNWSTNKIRVIHNPIISMPGKQQIDNEHIVLSIGDFNQDSCYETLIDAWERIISRYPQWRLRLYGNGNMMPYKDLIKQKKLSKTIYCYSLKNDMSDVYAMSSLYIHCQKKDKFGYRIMEAQSYGIPCIALSSPFGPKDLIKNEFNGFLIYNEQTSDLSVKLGTLMRNHEIREQMSKNAIDDCKNYSIENTMKQWYDMFIELFNSQVSPKK